MREIERKRRVNQVGTKENKGAQKVMENLHGWNSNAATSSYTVQLGLISVPAYSNSRDDVDLEVGLEDLNAGQTHRSRLLSAPPSERQHPDGGPNRLRGSGRGGRGGGNAGCQSSRYARPRVPEGLNTSGVGISVAPGFQSSATANRPLVSLPAATPAITSRPRIPASASLAGTNSRIRVQEGTFTLVPPSQFMSHQFTSILRSIPSSKELTTVGSKPLPPTEAAYGAIPTDAPTTEGIVSGITSAQTVLQTVGLPLSSRTTDLVRTRGPVDVTAAAEPTVAQLSEAELSTSDIISEVNPPKSYAEDLLDIEITETTRLPTPMAPHHSFDESGSRSVPSAAALPHQQESMDRVAAFLPALQSIVPAGIVQQLKSALMDLQQSILGGSSGGTYAHRSRSSINAQPGLSQAVQERTNAWRSEIIEGKTPTGVSILGDHIVRSRFAAGEVSAAPNVSMPTPAGSPALTERLARFHLNEPTSSLIASRPPGNAVSPSDGPCPGYHFLTFELGRRAPALLRPAREVGQSHRFQISSRNRCGTRNRW
ncbi:MAG: hypothetical protein Q9220_003960 [cf. Caloplaca sp. 1 TL-2023]